MKRIVFGMVCFLALAWVLPVFGATSLVENQDYFVDLKKNPRSMPDVLHVNFINAMPRPYEAEEIVREQVKIYGERSRSKNIIGSAWYTASGDESKFQKIKFNKDLGAYVWLARSKRVVTFTNYMYILKRDKENSRLKARAAASEKRKAEAEE